MNTQAKANQLREEVMRVACKNNKGHIAPSLSCLDILTVLCYQLTEWNDEIVLSKGHGCYGLYAIYADKGIISKDTWENFDLPGCLNSFGSLGHGLPVAVGLAYALKGHVWCIVGDGEMQEGSCWEALSFLKHHELKNITVIVDHNGLQAMDKVENILSQNLFDRLDGWGFQPLVVDGHCHEMLKDVLSTKPQVVIAETVKGHGCLAMENQPHFHYRVPNDTERFSA